MKETRRFVDMPLHILLADDHHVVRRGTSIILSEAFPDIHIGQAGSFAELLMKLTEQCFDLLLLDINLPDGKDLLMIDEVRKKQPDIKILMFSAYSEERYAVRYIHAGADGYLQKFSTDSEIINAVKSVVDTGTYISSGMKEKILDDVFRKSPANPLDVLSARELEIARLLARGEGNLEISNRLYLHTSTVSTYKSRIFEKLDIKNIVSLAELIRVYG